MINKKVVSRFISSLTAFTAFLYCFKIPISADTYSILDTSNAYYQLFLDLGFEQVPLQEIQNNNQTISFTGTISENGGFTISSDNFSGVESSNMAVRIGDGYGVANDIISGTLGSTSQQLICNPNPLSENIGDNNVTYPKYSCYYYAQNYGTQQNISLTQIVLDGTITGSNTTNYSGSFSGSSLDFTLNNLNGTITGTIKNNKILTLPWLKYSGNSTSIPVRKINQSASVVDSNDNNIYLLAYISFDNYTTNNSKIFQFQNYINGNLGNFVSITPVKAINVVDNNIGKYSGYFYWKLTPQASPNYTNIRINPDITGYKILPIYFGYGYHMPDECRNLCGLESRTSQLLTKGNTVSQTAQNNATNTNNTLEDTTNNLYSLENTFNDDLDNAFNNINIDNSLITNNGFINSAQWLSNQFTNIVSPAPINNMIMFSLILGLAMVLIGKVRN